MKPDDPAYPIDIGFTDPYGNRRSAYSSQGLTIRQEFAARAMQGLLASGASLAPYDDLNAPGLDGEQLANAAVGYADDLIAALQEEGVES